MTLYDLLEVFRAQFKSGNALVLTRESIGLLNSIDIFSIQFLNDIDGVPNRRTLLGLIKKIEFWR